MLEGKQKDASQQNRKSEKQEREDQRQYRKAAKDEQWNPTLFSDFRSLRN